MPRVRRRGHAVRVPESPVESMTDAELEQAFRDASPPHQPADEDESWALFERFTGLFHERGRRERARAQERAAAQAAGRTNVLAMAERKDTE